MVFVGGQEEGGTQPRSQSPGQLTLATRPSHGSAVPVTLLSSGAQPGPLVCTDGPRQGAQRYPQGLTSGHASSLCSKAAFSSLPDNTGPSSSWTARAQGDAWGPRDRFPILQGHGLWHSSHIEAN